MQTCQRALLARGTTHGRYRAIADEAQQAFAAASQALQVRTLEEHICADLACPRNTSAPGLGSPPPQSSVGLVFAVHACAQRSAQASLAGCAETALRTLNLKAAASGRDCACAGARQQAARDDAAEEVLYEAARVLRERRSLCVRA